MSEISDWIQEHWFELGSLLVQFAILATLFWYGRRVSGALLASQNPAEAPQRLSPSGAPAMQTGPLQAGAQFGVRCTGHVEIESGGTWHDLIRWLQEPMGEVAAWRRVARWLQAPLRS